MKPTLPPFPPHGLSMVEAVAVIAGIVAAASLLGIAYLCSSLHQEDER